MKKNKIISPVGLKGQAIDERMKALMGIGDSTNESSKVAVELTKKGPDGNAYAIIRENREWYIKKTTKTSNILAEDFQYIGGLMNKKQEAYPSYAKALKQLGLKFKSLAEAHNYEGEMDIMKNDYLLAENLGETCKTEEVEMTEEVDVTEEVEMTEAEKAIDDMLSETSDDDDIESEEGTENDVMESLSLLETKLNLIAETLKKKVKSSVKETKYKLTVPDPTPVTEPVVSKDIDTSFDTETSTTDDKPFDDEPFDAGVEADEETDPKKFIQQLTGKLGQSLRKYNEEQGQPDFELEKFAINSLLSATHTSEMDAEDQKDIINKVKSAGKDDDMSSEQPEEEPMNDEQPAEEPSDAENLNFGGEEEIEENMMTINPKKLSIFAPEGSEEAEYQKTHNPMEKESNNYMFWQNLKTIHHAAGELLKMNCDEVDALLSDGHGWALDHIATSADDVEEVYHFVEGRLNDFHVDSEDNYEMEDEWSAPMELHTETPISDDLKYHIENSIPLNENIYRIGSDKYFNLIKEVKTLYSKGLIKLNENDAFIVNEFDNQYIMLEGKKLKMNFIYEEVETEELNEAEYKGKKVKLGKPKRGGSKKFYVYVRDPKSGNVKKVSFGAKAGGGNLAVKLRDPKARKAFSDRHNCPSKTDRTTPGYWACRLPQFSKQLNLSGGGTWW